MQHRLLCHTLCALLLIAATLITSCHRSGKDAPSSDTALAPAPVATDTAKRADTSERGREMERLLNDFEQRRGESRTATADTIFDLVHRAEITDDRLQATPGMKVDSLNMLVWYWAGEYFYRTQDYTLGLHYALRALQLFYRHGDPPSQSDCEQLVGLFYFRMSDCVQALEHTRKCVELDRRQGDQSRISSSLNMLAGICLVARQLEDGERYVLEALRYSMAAGDSNRIAIEYGMASEIYLAMGRPQESLSYARQAYDMDEARGNTAKVGIRLSQIAAALIELGQDEEAERAVLRAMPILEKAGNEQSLSMCHSQMGTLLNRRGAHAEAARYYRQAAESFAARKNMYNESRARMGLYEALKDADPAEASRQLLRYAALKDSIYHHDVEQTISHYNVRYKTEELALQQARDRIMLAAGVVLIAVLLLIVAILIYMSRVRHRSHRMLKQLSRVREDFFTNITHEFRTPLTVILGLSRELQSPSAEPDETQDKARTIERQGNGLLSLINQLLDISKVKSAVGNTDWRHGNISAFLSMTVESYRDYARSRGIDLQFFSKGKVEMDFVPDYVVKVMNNLLSNAFKFTPAHGKVSVLCWREDDLLRVDVTDTGQGMDKESLKHVFEPFYQGRNQTADGLGTGVGLALVRQIMDAVEGRITVESKPNQGTTFHLSAPIRNRCRRPIETEVDPSTPQLPEAASELLDTESEDSACRLLVIEDNRDIAAYIGSQFTDRYAVSYATDGNAGLDKALTLVPDLIITDLMIPGMDGLEVCRRVRANEIINHIPIIVVTAKITESDRIAGIAAGADAYLSKPFNSDELRTRVEKLLEGRRMLQEKFMQTVVTPREEEPKNQDVEAKPDEEPSEPTQLSKADLCFLAKVTDAVYLQLSRQKEFDLSLIATSVCMSYSQFYRKVNALTGYKPSAYIRRIKINKAKILLREDPKMNFGEVANRCGFSDYSNFVHAFKDVCGITPTAYRRDLTQLPE